MRDLMDTTGWDGLLALKKHLCTPDQSKELHKLAQPLLQPWQVHHVWERIFKQ